MPHRQPSSPSASRRRLPGWVLGLCLGWASAGPLPFELRLLAHEGPEHEIEELTALLKARGDSPDLLIERAIEYGVLGKYTEAIHDLERALQLDPNSIHAFRELGRLQSLNGKTDDAIATVSRALRLGIEEPIDRGGLLILRAELLRSKDRDRRALEDCQAAIGLHPRNPEWYLLRSDLQRRLKLHKDRIAGLEAGLTETGAGVLAIERIEALLDAKEFAIALKAIEPELDSSRLKEAWLVRRGRARLGLGDRKGGEEDLRAALAEIGTLLNPARPDATLLLDQATALVLLGDLAGARQAYQLAKDKGGAPDLTRRIQALLPP
ncbi:MAG: tetratricopeptide repeat protein [Limisphaerales bacterium]